jgi:class 3 adenylate cyclase/tetratricopeptide (TPR) repeat protein
MERICPKCQFVNPPQFKFCGECGQDLQAPKEPTPIEYDQPRSYTPKHLAEKILNTRSALEGERKLVTVMFADVAGFTSLSEKLEPEEVHQIMEGCLRILMDEIHKYEGTINQFTGDGVMALFGAPLAHEDHAQRACYAALAIQKDLAEYNEKIKKDYGREFKMRIGINSGPVVVGSIGDDLHMDYTAIGDTINLASRMESLAQPGTVLLSRDTHRLVKDYFDLKPIGPLEVKGKEEPQEAFELVKAGGAATRLEASMARGLTRFVGRENSMAALMEAYDKVKNGTGQVVGMVGEAGVGKSRLLFEFRHRLPQEFGYLEGHCIHYGGAMPYLPILDLLRSYFEIREGEREMVIRKRVKERILGLDEKLQGIISPIQDLLSLKVEDEAYLKLEPKQRREKVFEALRDLFIRQSQERPLVLVIEDLHWIDKTSEEFLDYLIGWLANVKVMLVLLYRPEYTHNWGNKSYFNRIGLDQLTIKSSAELVRAILEGGETAPELSKLILNRAAGNPLFMEELTHSLLENGSIQKTGDQYVLSQKSSDHQVPDTIQGIIAARIDRLEENLKRIMQVASVIGREFAFRILQAISDLREDLKSELLNLQGLELIYEKSLFPELEYVFKHALTQEVAYNSLLSNRRKEIHNRIGKAIEEIYTSNLEEFYEVLAYHYSKSGNPTKAYEYLKKSAEKAVRNDAAVEAVRFYREAMEVLCQLPPSEENHREQIELVLFMQIPWRKIGFSEDYLPLLQKAEALAEDLGEVKKRLMIRSVLGTYYIYKGDDPQLGWTFLESCLDYPEILQDDQVLIPVGVDLCTSCTISGDFQRINQVAPTIIGLIERGRTQAEFYGKAINPYSVVLASWGMGTGFCGDFDQGQKLCEKALSYAREINHLSTLAYGEMYYGVLFLSKGDGPNAVKHLQEAISFAEESQTVFMVGVLWTYLGLADYLMGEFRSGLDLAEKGLGMHKDLGLPFLLSFCHWSCGVAHIEMGELEEAQTHFELGLQSALQNQERMVQAVLRCYLGLVMAGKDPTHIEAAEDYIRQGITQLEELGIRAFYTLGYMIMGEVYAESGRPEEALEPLKKAEGMFQEMGMDYWLGRTRDLLGKL